MKNGVIPKPISCSLRTLSSHFGSRIIGTLHIFLQKMSETAEAFNSKLKFLKGKYDWSDSDNKLAESVVQRGTIDKYGWADGTKNVSIYIDVKDDVPDDEISILHTSESVTLAVQGNRLHIPKLANEITDAKFQRKLGKDTLVVKLVKKQKLTWSKLAGEIINKDSGCYTKDDVKSRVVLS